MHKRMIQIAKVLLLVSPILFCSSFSSRSSGNQYSISITVTNIRNNKGTMQFQVYRDQEHFKKEHPYRVFRVAKTSVSNKKMTYTIEGLYPDTYGIALLDDENSNKKMDYGLIMPVEGFGFSDYYHTGWSRPVFDQFKFKLDKDKSVTMKVRYV